ncbi:hypothetical protein [Algoriphagus boritolerans]|nr:hypothetical protein [Algoriphagus boritolerans]
MMVLISRLFQVFFLLIFLSGYQAFAQSSASVQVEDYVILKNGRRFDGTVMRKLGQLDFEQIEFLRRGETEIYTPEDIQAFGLGTGEYFRSMDLPSTPVKRFVQVFYAGEVILGKDHENFYAGSEGDMKLLTGKSEPDGKGTEKSYKLTLSKLLAGDCLRRVSGQIRSSKLNEDDLVWLFRKYYDCKGGDFTFYGKARPPYLLSPIVRVGVFESGIKSHIKNGDRKDVLNSSPLIQGYAGLSIHSLRRYPRFSADAGLSFESSQLTWESQYVGSSIKVTGTEEMSHSFISLPFLINYSLFKTRKKDFFVGLGAGYGISLSNSDFAIQEELVTYSDRILLEEGSFTTIRSGGFFYQAQAGFLVNLPSERALTFSVLFRQLGDYYVVKAGTNTANYHKLDFGFGVGFRF